MSVRDYTDVLEVNVACVLKKNKKSLYTYLVLELESVNLELPYQFNKKQWLFVVEYSVAWIRQ